MAQLTFFYLLAASLIRFIPRYAPTMLRQCRKISTFIYDETISPECPQKYRECMLKPSCFIPSSANQCLKAISDSPVFLHLGLLAAIICFFYRVCLQLIQALFCLARGFTSHTADIFKTYYISKKGVHGLEPLL